MFQLSEEDSGYAGILNRRKAQTASGRATPQVNGECGCEDHHPAKWGEDLAAPALSGDSWQRRLPWEMTMAGCCQMTGERTNGGTVGDAPATQGI